MRWFPIFKMRWEIPQFAELMCTTKNEVKFHLHKRDCKWGRKFMFIDRANHKGGPLKIPFQIFQMRYSSLWIKADSRHQSDSFYLFTFLEIYLESLCEKESKLACSISQKVLVFKKKSRFAIYKTIVTRKLWKTSGSMS